jgi:hypothetical protein
MKRERFVLEIGSPDCINHAQPIGHFLKQTSKFAHENPEFFISGKFFLFCYVFESVWFKHVDQANTYLLPVHVEVSVD